MAQGASIAPATGDDPLPNFRSRDMRRSPTAHLARACCLLLALAPLGRAAAQSPVREHLAPPGWEGSYHGIHYTPVVRIGDRVIVSGIPAIEGNTDEEKIRWLFQQLQVHLAQAGATLDDVVELNSYHLAHDHAEFRRQMDVVLKVHREFFKDHYPAWTAVGTTALFSQGAPMELRAEAVIGSGRAAKVSIPPPAPRPAH
jgi:enamine deaminase RidA (YjgF/YER057c/UK114 family)